MKSPKHTVFFLLKDYIFY